MSFGLRVFNSAGNPVMEITDRVSRIAGSLETGAASGSTVVPLFSTGTPYCIVILINAGSLINPQAPVISIVGTTLTWTYSGSYPSDAVLIYGVY